MKKIFTFLSLLLLLVSCSKEIDVSQSAETTSEQVTFSATRIESDVTTKAITLKDSWNDGDQIAIFINNGDDTYSAPYCYDIAPDGTMTPAEGEEGIIIVVRTEDIVNYHAFYPYDSSLTTYDEYKSASETANGNTDYLFTQASGTTEVEFTFSHTLAAVFVSVLTSSSDLALSYTFDGKYANALPLEYEINTSTGRYISSFFIEETTDLSNAILIVSANQAKTYYSFENEEITSWEAGKVYTYNIILSTGAGTESDPFIITTVEEMKKVGSGTDGWDLDSHYRLLVNLDLGGSDNPWTPIGTSDNDFTGTFDGYNNMISGLYINDSSSDYQGLFGCTNTATIKNLGISGKVTGNKHVGGLVGAAYSSTITDCYNTAEISGEDDYIGGIVGVAYTTTTIANCYNTATVSGASDYVGGVTGYTESSDVSITNCYNTGDISGTSSFIGGVVGYSNCSLTDCYNTATVKGDSSVGGLAGIFYASTSYQGLFGCIDGGTIKNISVSGEVTGYYYIGSVVGYASSSSIINCYNIGTKVTGNRYVGGVVGRTYSSSSIINCCNAGSVSGSSYWIGGVIGLANSSSLTGCYNTGDITGTGTSSTRIGGIVGYSTSTPTINNCYNTGKVSTNYASGSIGGVIGYNDSETLTMNYCYFNSDNFSGELYIYSSSGEGTVTNSESKTDEEMKASDFVTLLNTDQNPIIWKSDTESVNNGYPVLINE